MSILEELIQEKCETSSIITRDRYISMCIIQAYYREHGYNHAINDVFTHHNELVSIISNNQRWEPFTNGYLTRTDYKYDDNQKEITFTTHRIIKQKDKYISDSTDISTEHLNNHIGDFTALAKVDDIIYNYYLKDKEQIDRNVNSVEAYQNPKQQYIEDRIKQQKEQNDLYFKSYGPIGRELLIKWLNRLNDDTSIEELVSEFKNDVNLAKIYLEKEHNPNYRQSQYNRLDMADILLKILETYSPRGGHLRSLYRIPVKVSTLKKELKNH